MTESLMEGGAGWLRGSHCKARAFTPQGTYMGTFVRSRRDERTQVQSTCSLTVRIKSNGQTIHHLSQDQAEF